MTNTNCENIENCNSCNSCNYCNYCDYCYYCYSSVYCNYCNSCYSCNYCKNCYYCYSCYSCKNLKMTEYNLFCYSENYNDENSFQQKRYRAFNKEVGEERYYEIKELIKNDILKDLKLELNENTWKDEWKKVTPEQWSRILAIPEADKKVIEAIVGFEIDEEEEMTTIKVSKSTLEALKKEGIRVIKE